MTNTTRNLLLFGIGILWAMKSSKKAYAPTITHSTKKTKKPKSQQDCEADRLYRENRCVEECDIDERKTYAGPNVDIAPGYPNWWCEKKLPPRSQADCPPNTRFEMQLGGQHKEFGRCRPTPPSLLKSGDLVKMCTVSTCGKCYCGTGQQAFMKILSISGCDYQLEVMNNNDSLTGNPLTQTKGHIYNWNDRNCSSPGMAGFGSLVKLDEIEKANLNSRIMLEQMEKGPQSQADCGPGLVFYKSYPCGIPGCAWKQECITPAEKILRQNAPVPA